MVRITSFCNRKGSSAVLLAMVFVTFALCITGAIGICRELAVKSECEAFGRVWTRAILSEYDVHLLEDYGIMAFFGDENEVNSTIDSYIDYSAAGKLDADFGGTVSELSGYELGQPGNFRKAMKASFVDSIGSVISGKSRHVRDDIPVDSGSEQPEGRKIGNAVVLDTLPSGGLISSVDADSIARRAEGIGSSDGIRGAIAGAGLETSFIWTHFGNYVTQGDTKESFFRNEWEYVICGNPDDKKNYDSCRRRLFMIRNALDLASLYKDSTKVELITAAAELITPGPLGAATQLLIAEAWAALEAEADLDALYSNERVPVIKGPVDWKISLESVLGSDSVQKKLDEESKQLLNENKEELDRMSAAESAGKLLSEGLNYDEHLMLMIIAMNSDTRLLRIMDLIQINMKYRYYRDFNLMEYFTGVRFTIRANGRDYCFEQAYK